MFKRIFLFALVNILVILTVTLMLNIFGIGNYITSAGLNYSGLFLFCLVWGMAGSGISLLLSKWMAKKFMGVQLITENGPHQNLVSTVHRLSRRAGLTTMPEVGIFQANEINAFATGPSRNNSLIAVSTALVSNMNDDEIEGVLAHEVAHIANGDMVTMALVQGVLNAFVMFFSRIIAYIIDQQMRNEDGEEGGLGPFAYMMVVILLQIVFGVFASILTNWFSRYREFKADIGGADLASKEKMLAALICLQKFYPQLESVKETPNSKNFQAMQISSKEGFMFLFSSHPPLNQRIAALKAK